MIFVDSLSQLRINNLCRNEKPYSQPVVTASDINLQGRLPEQSLNNYSVKVVLYNCTGEVFIQDVTNRFRIQFGVSIYNFRYFNLQLREWGEDFPVDCFTLRVEIRNNGQLIFNKITETYQRLNHSKRCYIELTNTEWDDFSLGRGYLRVNQDQLYNNINELANHFEPVYHQGTNKWNLYFDCSQVNKITILRSNALAFPLTGVLGGGIEKNLPIYAVYVIDEDGCNLPYTRIESTYDCLDNVTGLYYGDPKLLLNYHGNDPDLRYSNSQWIESEIKKQPAEYEKQISFLGRVQRIDVTQTYKFTGLIPFPQWKMEEIEAIFSGKRIYVDSEEYIHRKGVVFKTDTIRNTCSWLLDVSFEKKVITNDFSCQDDCTTLCTYYVIWGGLKDQAYFDENGKIIGHTFNELLNYFNSFSDVISIEEYPSSETACQPVAIIKIDSFGFLPSFIHYWEYSPANRVYAQKDDCVLPKNLCNGVEGLCLAPNGIKSTCEIIEDCQRPSSIITNCVDLVITKGGITLNKDWVLASGSKLEVDQFGNAMILLKLENHKIPLDTNLLNENIGTLNAVMQPKNTEFIEKENLSVMIMSNGDLYVSSDNLDFTKGYLELTLNINYNINGN
ncbi:hypothetical protein QP519_10470 [Weeksella virosa]|uniref:hypothetical protein n=1 Tax=Weeksella virosa TaxID=1014 RepID=UPI0025537FF1|nr:hypothetical protein [Weeksella virosa]MDK7375958.1 hypothetical protein [Weeksella virosa]